MIDDGDDSELLGTASKLSSPPATVSSLGGDDRNLNDGHHHHHHDHPTSTNMNDEDYRSKIRELRQAFLDSNIVSVNDTDSEHRDQRDREHQHRGYQGPIY